MKPGLTCLWQISGRNEVDFDRWIQLDLGVHRLLVADASTSRSCSKTIPVVLSGRGAS